MDFDGIICENAFPEIGKPKYKVICLLQQLIDKGHEVILWTSRADDELNKAVQWCTKYGLHFTAVNENAPSNRAKYEAKYPQGTRKVYADVYIDDHNLEYISHESGTADYYLIKFLEKGVRTWKKTEEN